MNFKASKRKTIYLMIPLVLAVLVIIQQQVVIKERARHIVSTYGQWQEQGKPVTVKKAELSDVKEYMRITLSDVQADKAEAFLDLEQRSKLQVGQKVYSDGQGKIKAGSIIRISQEADRQTAMYGISVKLDSEIKDKMPLIFVNVKTYKKVISLPNEIIDNENGEYFVWKAVRGRAVRQKVEVLCRNGYGAIISSGVSAGDIVIYTGQSQLEEGDKIKMTEVKGV